MACMSTVYEDNSKAIGRTPLVRIHRITAGAKATVLAKIEGRNPAYSVKCRIGAAMVWDAEKRGLLGSDKVILEATSGNTGIALAFAAAARGYACTLVMPDTMSMERRKVLVALGATLILTPGAQGMKGAIARAEALAAAEPGRYVLMRQFDNPANPSIHEETTGAEIWEATDGGVDVLVSGVGTGGTLTGVSRYFEQRKNKPLLSVAVEPNTSPVISQAKAGEPLVPGPHKIQGLGAGFIPKNLDTGLLDGVIQVGAEAAREYGRRSAREEGLLVGISSGATLAAIAQKLPELPAGSRVLGFNYDTGERYLSVEGYLPA